MPRSYLRIGIPLIGRKAIPLHGFLVVLRNAPAVGVQSAEVVLSDGIPLIGGEAIPLHSFLVVLRNAFAVGVRRAEVVLSFGIPLISREAKPLHGFLVVLRNALAKIVPDAKLGLRPRIPALGQWPKLFDRLKEILTFQGHFGLGDASMGKWWQTQRRNSGKDMQSGSFHGK